jgi:hypothetical protein
MVIDRGGAAMSDPNGAQYQAQPPQYGPDYQPDYPPAPPPYQPAMYNAPPPGYGYPAPVYVQQPPSNGVGVAGFVTGLLGLILCWFPVVGLILGVLGIILGGVGISTSRKTGAGSGLAIAGLVLGVISLVPAIIIIAAVSSVTP